MTSAGTNVIEILLVEDNPGDVLLTKHAFEKSSIENNISVAEDGEQALDYLHKRNGFEKVITPDLVLLDLNMPKKDGRDVLSDAKQDENLRRIPIIMLTSSKAEQDIRDAYDLYANGYILKPTDLSKFSEIVSAIEAFWFSLAVLPPSP